MATSGDSILLHRSVASAILERLPVTLSLAGLALVAAVVMGILAGVLAAIRHGTWSDQSIMTLALLGLSVPDFWLGMVLIFLFAVGLGWFPAGGYIPPSVSLSGWAHCIILPACSLAAAQLGFIARMSRSAMLEVLGQDFIRTADAKGLPWRVVVTRHALPNALVPILTVAGIVAGGLLGGALVIEQVFSFPGVGRLIVGRGAEPRFPGHPGQPAVRRPDLPRQHRGGHALRRRRSAGAPWLARPPRATLRAAGSAPRCGCWPDGRATGAQPFVPGRRNAGAVRAAGGHLRDLPGALRSDAQQFPPSLAPPSSEHWFGTDHFGRDLLSRVIYGGRVSMTIGLMAVLATGVLGTTIGATAGYFRSLDNLLMRLMDALMAFPTILVAIVISAVLGASVTNVVIALGIATTPHTARIVRSSVLVTREMEFVEAARALGAGEFRLLFGHVLVNALAPLIVRLTYVFAIAILAEAVLSYVGVGPPPPTPTFGNIIAGERDFHHHAPWAMLSPGLPSWSRCWG